MVDDRHARAGGRRETNVWKRWIGSDFLLKKINKELIFSIKGAALILQILETKPFFLKVNYFKKLFLNFKRKDNTI